MTTKARVLENKYIDIDDRDVLAVVKALERRQLAGTADVVGEYEEQLAHYFGVKHALAVSSGTAALHLLLYLFDVKPGDEVIVPPTAPIMSALPILAVGAKPVFVDIEADNFSLDIADLERKLTSRTKAIVSVPMWGYPTALMEVKHLAAQHHIPLIEDASHCHGSRMANRFVGTTGDVSFFSTQERKLIATGEGGFILTHNGEIANKVKEVRDFGKPVRKTPKLLPHLGQYGYLFGLNFRLAAMSAALGISQLAKLDTKIADRNANAKALRDQLSELEWLQELLLLPGAASNYYSIVFRTSHALANATEIARLLYEHGIISDTYRFGIQPLYKLPIFAKFASSCPNSEKLLREIITLPTHEGMSEKDIERIAQLLKKMDY